jgi:phage portal protein BeeE
MGLVDRLLNTLAGTSRSDVISLDEWATWFGYQGNVYGLPGLGSQTLPGEREERIEGYQGHVQQAYKRNGVVFACMLARMMLFSEARFQFQALVKGRPGELFSTPELARLERPSVNRTTGDLLARMIQDADLAGNWYGARRVGRIKRLRPDWVTIVMGSDADPQMDTRDIDAEVVAYIYHPGGTNSGIPAEVLLPETVAHFAPIPDPGSNVLGMSWLTPLVREIMADSAATSHKLAFFENGATPNLYIKRSDIPSKESFNEWVELMESQHAGLANAYKTMYMTAGADATVIGADMQQIDFKVTQGAGETRIAAAAGVPAPIVGISEGLQGSSLNAGNYGMSRRRFADLTMRPLWRNAAGSLESIINVPNGSRLWYDDRDIPFLQEDVKDGADIFGVNAKSLSTLITGGFPADDAINAVLAGDLARLSGTHTGLLSVQLQPPSDGEDDEDDDEAEPVPEAPPA